MRVLEYLKGTPEEFLTLSMKDTKMIKWWVDVSYAVHGNMRSHTWGVMPMWKGALYYTYHKQKINTKISTEEDLMDADDVMPQLLRTR